MSAAARFARQAFTRERLARVTKLVEEERTDESDELQRLFSMSNPLAVEHRPVMVGVHCFGLAYTYNLRRRACVLRAWCAKRLGWPKLARVALDEARHYRELVRHETKRELAKLFGGEVLR